MGFFQSYKAYKAYVCSLPKVSNQRSITDAGNITPNIPPRQDRRLRIKDYYNSVFMYQLATLLSNAVTALMNLDNISR